ncbi:MAG: Tat pathway signal protein [Caulobacteraceae bacterium]|nr:Tat pathway signal protein [Caulobacteraceae bacterium]
MNRRRLLALAAAPLVLAPLAARAEQNEKRKKGGGASYIQIDTLTATILRTDGRRGVMTVEAGIDVPDSGLRARAQALAPRLRAAYDEVVRTYASGLPTGAVPNADYLGRELQRQTDMVLGRPGGRLLLGTILVN